MIARSVQPISQDAHEATGRRIAASFRATRYGLGIPKVHASDPLRLTCCQAGSFRSAAGRMHSHHQFDDAATVPTCDMVPQIKHQLLDDG